MTEREKKHPEQKPGNRDDKPDSFIPGRHGKHGGSEESEGVPQEQAPEAERPPEHNGADRTRH